MKCELHAYYRPENSNMVTIGELDIYFSYSTPVAFRYAGGLEISENIWSKTTGKHLNAINPDKDARIPNEEFKKKLNDLLSRVATL